jgi:hypothetical protein
VGQIRNIAGGGGKGRKKTKRAFGPFLNKGYLSDISYKIIPNIIGALYPLHLHGDSYVPCSQLFFQTIGTTDLLLPCSRRTELSVIYQNRAAAKERLEELDQALVDLQTSIDLNNRYGTGTHGH